MYVRYVRSGYLAPLLILSIAVHLDPGESPYTDSFADIDIVAVSKIVFIGQNMKLADKAAGIQRPKQIVFAEPPIYGVEGSTGG